MTEFVTPEFLQNHSTEEVHEKMKQILPADLDLSEGGHSFNMTMPTALVVAELCEFILPEVIKLIFPEWSYGEFLDGHAKARRITRRAATAANGELTITGEANTVIPEGSLFSTAAVNDEPAVEYMTLEAVTISASKTVKVPIQCTQAGIVGNAQENTIVLVTSKNTGIVSVTNEEAITGGTEEESDESLIVRIDEYDKSQGDSYVGSVADYRRWAMSVPGVGEAAVIPAQDDSGTVTIIITDANGDPATEQLCTEVYNYIMRPDDPGSRLAPPNAQLIVSPPATMEIGITATVELDDEATIEAVKASFLVQLTAYLQEAMADEEIKYTRIHSALSATDGVNDFANLKIGIKGGSYGTENIPITTSQLPTVSTADIALTSGSV